ncbi:amidase family protein [Xanthobacter autotrophicus DSM 431]|uniref:amidase family protein n=1 Tax=Xanthobacter nonsaccharivorans TaxID=3119912 RepID=UPI0037268102
MTGSFGCGAFSPLAAVEACLAAARDAPDAFITLTPARALAEAAASAERYAAGEPTSPLDGICVSYKDLIDCAGETTTAGSPLHAGDAPARADAPLVAALCRAGAICVGKTNLTEFAFSVLGWNPHFGTPDNPRVCGHVPGGSSSGAAVAVARGACHVAIGTDTSGSVRVPAAFCGLVGFKPSPQRYPLDGTFPLAPSLDTIGLLAHHVEDIAVVDGVLARTAAAPATNLAGARFIIPQGLVTQDLAPDVEIAFARALTRLRNLGIPVAFRPVAALDAAHAAMMAHGPLVGAEAARVHADLLKAPERLARIDPNVRARLELAARMPEDAYRALLSTRARLCDDLVADIGDAMLLFPTVPHLAPELAPLITDPALFARVNLRTLRNTMLGSFLRMPGLALPLERGPGALPASLLLSCAEGGDARLLAIGCALAEVLGQDA